MTGLNSLFRVLVVTNRDAGALYPDLGCLGTLVDGKYEFMTYKEVLDTTTSLADGMRSIMGLPKVRSFDHNLKPQMEWREETN